MISCASAGDFSPLLPLTVADAITLDVYQGLMCKRENQTMLTLADIQWLMLRISKSLTGVSGYETLPSEKKRLEELFEARIDAGEM